MQRLTVAALCVALFSSLAQAQEGHPIITTDWTDVQGTQDDCLNRAARSIAQSGFQSPGITTSSRHGYRGPYTVAIRCAVDKGFVLFVVAGPSGQFTEQYVNQLKAGF
jgi:hypothetical protein